MSQEQDGCGCKIGHITTKYRFTAIDSRLTEGWRSGKSIRQLTDELNKNVIETELTDANVGHVKWSQAPVYKALHTDELSQAEAIEIRRELERAGIDVEQLASDLVSHQTVYRHLTQCLDASKETGKTPDERRATARDTVYALQQRTERVTESTLDSLQSTGVTNLGETEVLVNLQVMCDDCNRSMDFETAISDGCNCGTT